MPFACVHVLDDKEQQARCVAAMEAFNAPYSMMLLELDAAHMYDTVAENQGKIFVSTEIGGGGSADATSTSIAKRGISNVLMHAGILPGEPERHSSIKVDSHDAGCFITCEHSGLLEMRNDLGDAVQKGDLIAVIHDTERTGTAPVEYRAEVDGILVGRHYPCLAKPGDNLAVVALKDD